MLRARGFDAVGVGVDLWSGMLALAREQGPVVHGDLRRPPLQDEAFDAVWSSAALLHMPMPDVARTLSAWHRLLRPGGRLGLSTSLGGQQGWELVPYATPKPVPKELSRWSVHDDREHLLTLLSEAGLRSRMAWEQSSRHHARAWCRLRRSRYPGTRKSPSPYRLGLVRGVGQTVRRRSTITTPPRPTSSMLLRASTVLPPVAGSGPPAVTGRVGRTTGGLTIGATPLASERKTWSSVIVTRVALVATLVQSGTGNAEVCTPVQLGVLEEITAAVLDAAPRRRRLADVRVPVGEADHDVVSRRRQEDLSIPRWSGDIEGDVSS